MTERRVEEMSTDELIREFIAGATELGGAISGARKYPEQLPPARTPQRQARIARQHVISAEICNRAPIAKIRLLYDHPDMGVREWAAIRFRKIDPDWSEAAFGAICNDMSAAQAMELRTRSQTLPPNRPTLQEMTDDQLVARFEDACMRRYGARFLHDPDDENGGPDIETKNRIISETVDIAEEIRGRNEGMRLVPFLDHPNNTICFVAAVHCLPVVPERALSMIEKIAASPDAEYFHEAGHTLDWWRKRNQSA